MARYARLNAVEDRSSLIEGLRGRATRGGLLLVVVEGVGVLLEVLLLNEVVALSRVHAKEIGNVNRRDGCLIAVLVAADTNRLRNALKLVGVALLELSVRR